MNIEVPVDTSQVDEALSRMPGAFARAQRRALEYIGQHIASDAGRAFRTASLRPSPWAPRKPSKRDDGHPLLIKSGALRQSIGWALESFDTVKAGTPFEYGRYLQHGTRNMPPRPFLPFDAGGQPTPRLVRKIEADIVAAYTEEIEAAFGR